MLIWLPHWITQLPINQRLPRVVAASAIGFSLLSIEFPAWVPPMVQDGHFTLLARGLNIVGGLLILGAAAKFVLLYRTTQQWDDFLFAIHCTLFGSAGVLFELSSLWDAAWWWWHILRLGAYGVALGYLVFTYMGVFLERQRMQEVLEESHARMRAVVETASDGIITINERGMIESVNAAAERIFQYQLAELKGQNVSVLMPSLYHEAQDGYLANHRDTGKAKIIGSIREVVGTRKNGEVFPLELSLSEVRWENQRMFTGFVRDISKRKEAEEERDALNKQLIDTSRRVGMADVATGVLHNVGNVLNSVNVAVGVVADTVRRSSVDKISRTAGMIQEHLHDVGHYLTHDPKGQQIPGYLNKLGQQLTQDQAVVLGELKELTKNIEHIKEIISVQQTVAKSSSLDEPVVLEELIQQALTVNQTSLDKYEVEVTREYMTIPEIVVDKHQVLQVLVNLISNAKRAMKNVSDRPRVLTFRLMEFEERDQEWVKFEVSDTGVGISAENLNRIFTQGFTTKKDGHGFGLHSGSLSAKLMGGTLTVHSAGEHQGATFTLTLPAKRREVGVA